MHVTYLFICLLVFPHVLVAVDNAVVDMGVLLSLRDPGFNVLGLEAKVRIWPP